MKKIWVGIGFVGLLLVAGLLWALLRSTPQPPAPETPPVAGAPGPAEVAGAEGKPPTPPPSQGESATPVPAMSGGDLFPTQKRKETHWFLQLGPEGLGLSRSEWLRLRTTTPHLGVPKVGPNPTTLAGFDYVTIERPSGKTSEDNSKSARELLAEARRQKVPTMASLMAQSRDLGLLEKSAGATTSPLEFLLPVPPGTRVASPLVVRQMPTLKVFAMETAVENTELAQAVRSLVQQARQRGYRMVPPLLAHYDPNTWMEAVEQGSKERLRVYLAVEGGD